MLRLWNMTQVEVWVMTFDSYFQSEEKSQMQSKKKYFVTVLIFSFVLSENRLWYISTNIQTHKTMK